MSEKQTVSKRGRVIRPVQRLNYTEELWKQEDETDEEEDLPIELVDDEEEEEEPDSEDERFARPDDDEISEEGEDEEEEPEFEDDDEYSYDEDEEDIEYAPEESDDLEENDDDVQPMEYEETPPTPQRPNVFYDPYRDYGSSDGRPPCP